MKKSQILVIFRHFWSYYQNLGLVWGVKFQKLHKILNMVLKSKLLMSLFQKNQNWVIWGHVTSFKGHFCLICGNFVLEIAIVFKMKIWLPKTYFSDDFGNFSLFLCLFFSSSQWTHPLPSFRLSHPSVSWGFDIFEVYNWD